MFSHKGGQKGEKVHSTKLSASIDVEEDRIDAPDRPCQRHAGAGRGWGEIVASRWLLGRVAQKR